MKSKKCVICKLKHSILEFNKNRAKKDGLQISCKQCNKKRSAAYYKRKTVHHREETKKQKRFLRKRNSQYIWDYLLLHPCVDCGNSNPVVLEFDHVTGDKLLPISVMIGSCNSLIKINEEIEKCEVRCANCHRIRTAIQLNWYSKIDTGL